MDCNPPAFSVPQPPWVDLPTDVRANILRRLCPDVILGGAERMCTTWRIVCDQPSFWRVIHMKYRYNNDYSVFRRAVDRSQGELIDVKIKNFGNDVMLGYFSERSSHLKILDLQSCIGIWPRGLTTAVQNFPHIEELHLFEISGICALDIETVGISCPVLNSFTFYNRNLYFQRQPHDVDNSDALLIAKNMPNLVRLCLVGNLLNNEGLLAILDCLLNLESLDLGLCFMVELQCDLGRRCLEQIRDFRSPFHKWDDRFYKYTSAVKMNMDWDRDMDRGYDSEDVDSFSDDSYDLFLYRESSFW